ncbi:RNase H family protein [Microvirga guangxiensis]|uniref:RNase H n=1 Tax=Microvirga guangxiensis TaxID=549386 RepID=A0A1G5LM87_9HYPH|nr:RNase H [Microvirga guangxiensis]
MTNGVMILTDCACLGNPYPDGWVAVITIAGGEQVITEQDRITTNNKLEMTAAIKALEAVPQGLPSSPYRQAICHPAGYPTVARLEGEKDCVRLITSL